MHPPADTDESFALLFDESVQLIQSANGYRCSIDAAILAEFASRRTSRHVLDMGCGDGILSILLALHESSTMVVGIDIQEQMIARAKRNAELNGVASRVTYEVRDIKTVSPRDWEQPFDQVVTNPPFYPVGSGRLNPEYEVAIARHEILCTLTDVLRAGRAVLAPKGRIQLILPARRLTDLVNTAQALNLGLSTLQLVYSFADAAAQLLLAELVAKRNTELHMLAPYIIYERPKVYAEPLKGFLQGLSAV